MSSIRVAQQKHSQYYETVLGQYRRIYGSGGDNVIPWFGHFSSDSKIWRFMAILAKAGYLWCARYSHQYHFAPILATCVHCRTEGVIVTLKQFDLDWQNMGWVMGL